MTSVLKALNRVLTKSEPWLRAGIILGLLVFVGLQRPRLGDFSWRSLLMEACILGLFGLGWLLSRVLGRTWTGPTFLWLYLFGLGFEVITEDFWEYRHVLFLIREDISLTFPLAWTGLCLAAVSISEWFYGRIRQGLSPNLKDHLLPRLDVISWWIVGGVAETLFHWLDVIHSYDHAFPLGLSPTGVPWAVYLGYAVCPGFLVNMLIRNLETPSRSEP